MTDHSKSPPVIGLDTGDRPPQRKRSKVGGSIISDYEDIPYLGILFNDVRELLLQIHGQDSMPIHGISQSISRLQIVLWELGLLKKQTVSGSYVFTLSVAGEQALRLFHVPGWDDEMIGDLTGLMNRVIHHRARMMDLRPRFAIYSHREKERVYATDITLLEIAYAVVSIACRMRLREEYVFSSGERNAHYEELKRYLSSSDDLQKKLEGLRRFYRPLHGRGV